MPDVGLLSASEPLEKKYKVVIRYSVMVEGLEVYNESYDVEKLASDLKKDEAAASEAWLRRIKCVICCRNRPGFSACVTRCLMDGKCCDEGHEDCQDVQQVP